MAQYESGYTGGKFIEAAIAHTLGRIENGMMVGLATKRTDELDEASFVF
jgi:hypothetical protein